jgi:hypothetical protein
MQNKPTSPGPAPTPVQVQAPAQPQAPAYPPGLGPRIISSGAAIPPALVHSSDSDGSGSGSSSGSGSQSSWDGAAIKTLASRLEETVTISLSPSQDRALYGAALDGDEAAVEASPDLHLSTLQPWERVHLETMEFKYPVADTVADGADDGGNLWAAEEEEIKYKPVPPEMPNCPVHGLICKKGICKEMAKIVREQERAKKEQEKKDGGKAANGRGRNGGRGEDFSFFGSSFP